MTELFLKIINMSISAGWLVLAVLVLRFALKKAPKWAIVTLWGIVAARLLFPFSIESALSLIPSAETVAPEIMTDTAPTIQSGIPVINNTVNSIISQTLVPAAESSVNPLEVLIPSLAVAWVLGAILIFVYTAISAITLRIKIGTSVRLSGNVYQSEYVKSPFVMGIFMPKIYIPFNMSDEATEFILAHEQSHLRRKDHWWKPLGFLLLTVHWFNPLMWVAYAALCKDIELACDERVIKRFDNEKRADYSKTLLEYSVNRGAVTACPLAFGEVGVRARVKSVLNYKKPAFWLVTASLIICLGVGVCFLTDPIKKPEIPAQSVETAVPSWTPIQSTYRDYGWEQAKADGCVMISRGELIEGERTWLDFVNKTYAGYEAVVRVYEGFADGYDDDIYGVYQISFDGEKYILRGSGFGPHKSSSPNPLKEEYKYLVRFASGDIIDEYDNYLLTNTPADELPADALADGNYYSYGELVYSASVRSNYVQYSCFGILFSDIDGDGIEEKCALGTDPEYEASNFILTVYDDKGDWNWNTFKMDYDSVSFVQDGDGKLRVQVVKNGDEPETHLYEIIPIHSLTMGLIENGEMIEPLYV